jgi:hypothetical protein
VYVALTPVYGNVTPPNDLTPLRAMNSFAIYFFFFPYPKENPLIYLLLNKY